MRINAKPLRNVFTFPMVTGSFPFAITEKGVKLRSHLVLYGVLLRVFAGIECLKHIYDLQNTMENNSFSFVTLTMNHLFLYSFVVVSFVLVIVKKNFFLSALKNCEIIDQELFRLGAIQFSADRFPFDVFLVFITVISPTLQIFIKNSVNFQFMTKNMNMIYLTMSVYTTVYPFVRVLSVIRQRFIALKNLLHHGASEPSQVKQHVRLVNMVQLHCLLSTSCRLLNKCFSLQLLLFFFIVFGNSVTGICSVIEDWQSKEDPLKNLDGIIIIFYSSVAYLVTYFCKSTSDAASEFNTLLYRLMTSDESANIHINKKLRLHLSMKREVIFTACGFFSINYTLIHSMTAAATTYLVILIQYGAPDAEP